jgi:hypothetical protein
MSRGGVLLVIVGSWVLFQVWGGDALDRLKITGNADSKSNDSTTPWWEYLIPKISTDNQAKVVPA